MKHTAALFCLAVIVASVECASISGEAKRTGRTSGFLEGLLGGIMGGPPKSNGPSHEPSSPNYRDFFKIPNISSLIPGLPFLSDPTASKSIPEILGIHNDPANHRIPGLTSALQLARNRVEVALNITNGLANGIHEVVTKALHSKDPVGAVRAITATVIDTYTTVAVNCPVIVVSGRVLQEGVRIAEEIAQSAGNVYFGTSTIAPTDYITG